MVGSKPTVKSVSTVICQVADMNRSVAFYRDTLGLTPGHTTPYWSDFQIGTVKLGLHPPFQGSSAPLSVPGKGWVLGLEVDDLKGFRARLEVAGTEISGEYHDVPSGVLLEFYDPDGHAIQAIQYGATSKDLA